MRLGNSSSATPGIVFTKLTEEDLIKLRTKALITKNLSVNNYWESFTVELPSWYDRKGFKQERVTLTVGSKFVRAIFVDTNKFPFKQGTKATWIIRIFEDK